MINIPTMKNPSIRNSSDYEDRNGLLGKKILVANEITDIFTVSDKSKFVTANINIVNLNNVTAEITIWSSLDKVPSDIDILEYKLTLEPNATFIRTMFIMDKLETLFARSNLDNIVIRVDGYDDRLV